MPRARLAVVVLAGDAHVALPRTLRALRCQTRRPAHVTVVTEPTSRAAAVARSHAAHVLVPGEGTASRAAVLNRALATLTDAPPEYVMVLGADTVVGPRFVETAIATLDRSRGLAAVSGVYLDDSAHGWLQRCQANENTRRATRTTTTGRVRVVAAAASVIRYAALAAVARARGDQLPGRPGDVYDPASLTEDVELTLAFRTLGWGLSAPAQCVFSTALAPTLGGLHRQRLDRYAGTLQTLHEYGLTRVTVPYHLQQVGNAAAAVMMWVLMGLAAAGAVQGAVAGGRWSLLAVALFALERVVTVWRGGRRARLITLPLVPELLYDMTLQQAWAQALVRHVRRRGTVHAGPAAVGA